MQAQPDPRADRFSFVVSFFVSTFRSGSLAGNLPRSGPCGSGGRYLQLDIGVDTMTSMAYQSLYVFFPRVKSPCIL